MSVRILTLPDPALRVVAEPVKAITPDLAAKIRTLSRALSKSRGAGLAAPQVGWSARVFVLPMDRVFINPAILATAGWIVEEEGCLSIPGVRLPVGRPELVRVEYCDLSGRKIVENFHGLEARVVQHEIDHLDGILFTDRAGS